MKKLLSIVVLTLVSTFVLVGCKKQEPEVPAVPEVPATNAAPANP